MKTSITSFVLALSIGTLAWGSTQIYATYCAPSGFHGWAQSFMTSSSAPCQAILGMITNSSALYATTIVAFFVGIVSAVRDGIDYILTPKPPTNSPYPARAY